MIFFFKQKTAYEMRISDWSSDVCSSDLGDRCAGADDVVGREAIDALNEPAGARLDDGYIAGIVVDNAGRGDPRRQGADLRLDNPGAEILDGARVDLDACALGRDRKSVG